MINKKPFCNICDKYILNKSSHNKTILHTLLSLSVVNKYYIVDVPVIEIDNVINKQIYDYNKKTSRLRLLVYNTKRIIL